MDIKIPEPIEFFSGTTGINNIVDAESLGPKDLVECIDFIIDENGFPYTRDGFTEILVGNYHSAPQCPNIPLVAEDRADGAALYHVNPDLSLKNIRNKMTLGARISYAKFDERVFYTNGYENGYVEDEVSYPWPKFKQDVNDLRVLSEAPLGQHLATYKGRMIVALDDVLLLSELHDPTAFERHRNFYKFESRILMVRPVRDGIFVSSSHAVYFLSGQIPGNVEFKKVSDTPAIEWLDIEDELSGTDLGLQSNELCALWVCTDSMCIGLPNGDVTKVNKPKINYPPTTYPGASLLVGRTFIHSF